MLVLGDFGNSDASHSVKQGLLEKFCHGVVGDQSSRPQGVDADHARTGNFLPRLF